MSVAEPKQARSLATRARLLDAAVDELAEFGYARLTTAGVAARAGVTRGAQQHHFPHKAALVSEAVQHLARRQLEEIRTASEQVGAGRPRIERVLDLFFELASGPLFIATLELTFAARSDAALAEAVAPVDREVSRSMSEQATRLFGDEIVSRPDFGERLRHITAAVRGLALLRLLGHPPTAVERQWRYTRAELVRLLTQPE